MTLVDAYVDLPVRYTVITANPTKPVQEASEFPLDLLSCLARPTEALCQIHGMLGKWSRVVKANPYPSHLYVTIKIPGPGNQNCDKTRKGFLQNINCQGKIFLRELMSSKINFPFFPSVFLFSLICFEFFLPKYTLNSYIT